MCVHVYCKCDCVVLVLSHGTKCHLMLNLLRAFCVCTVSCRYSTALYLRIGLKSLAVACMAMVYFFFTSQLYFTWGRRLSARSQWWSNRKTPFIATWTNAIFVFLLRNQKVPQIYVHIPWKVTCFGASICFLFQFWKQQPILLRPPGKVASFNMCVICETSHNTVLVLLSHVRWQVFVTKSVWFQNLGCLAVVPQSVLAFGSFVADRFTAYTL